MSVKSLVFCLLAAILLLGTSCSLIPDIDNFLPTPTTPPPTTGSPLNPTWTPPPTDGQTQNLPDFVSVIARVKPSVVAVTTEVSTLDFFGSFVQEGAGSGWIIDKDGYIVTNNHVVEGAQSVTVTLNDGRTFSAQTVRTDTLADLAVIKINVQNLPAASIGKSGKLQVGEWVVAIGNSLGLGISATKGIISSLGASVSVSPEQTLYGLIQTDAAINPGNSGGPLVNMAGEVVGINSVKIAQVGVEGMGYAISIDQAVPIIQDLIRVGYAVRPWLGLGLYTVDQQIASRYNLSVNKGALITEVAVGSPAEIAGLKTGDVIVRFSGQEITNVDELVQAIHSAQIGQTVEIAYWRGNQQNVVTATLAQSPPR